LDHGFFETLHGNIPTTGLFVQAIGPANRFWIYGTEDAFTIIPNFLVTGILAMVLSVVIIVWSARYIQQKNSPIILTVLLSPYSWLAAAWRSLACSSWSWRWQPKSIVH